MGSFDELEKVRVLIQSIIEKENKDRKIGGHIYIMVEQPEEKLTRIKGVLILTK